MKWNNINNEYIKELSKLEKMDAHVLLNISKNAPDDIIKKAYRKMAKIYHPDKANGFMRDYNEQVMKLINAAYEKMMK